ncbi:unnamed protein product [Didymodactylos carnosus]|uniref:Uncharacterized protein n=1 Tax=Didymodactylos carnosus TaxID=1234261 RepID=A0A815YY22_9BILA|nr:unnamed protein product [Didymodactylos carnosus]CAF4440161.1 unnamed protein product [Didymodactylos carnosus]
MLRRMWNEVLLYDTESDLSDFIKDQHVCVYRKETCNARTSITYKCSEYKKYPLCQFQLKGKESLDGYQLYSSEAHNHRTRAQTSRLPSPVRHNIVLVTDTGLTLRKIQKAVTVFNPQLSNNITKIRTHRQKNRCSIKSIEDLQA